MRIKILHKGLILVALPLFFGIAFVWTLCYGLSESNRIFQHELLLKDAMINSSVITRSTFAAKSCAMAFIVSKDKFFRDNFKSNVQEASDSYKRLKVLLKNEPTLKLPVDSLSKKDIMMSDPQFLINMHAFVRKLEKLSAAETANAIKAMTALQVVLVGGMLLSAVISISLAFYFCLKITSRILIIVNNTINLSKGTALNPPLKGNDEIAELDQFLFKSATELRELERFKKEMIGVVSHELKSPLSSVEMFLSSLNSGVFGELNSKAKTKVQRTHKSVIRLMGLVRELLYLDRLELEMRPEKFIASDILQSAVDSVRELADESFIHIEVVPCRATIVADRNRLIQVISNLLSNAVKFSPRGSTVIVETFERDGYFECRVSDRGLGVPEELRKEIFEPFKQICGVDTFGSKKGTGLGLTISQSIIEQHQGKIGVDSIEGKGSTFWFQIPVNGAYQADFCPIANPLSISGTFKALTKEEAAAGAKTTKSAQARSAMGLGRFSLLQKGLIIISVPLIFQLAFMSVIGCLLLQVREHINREEHAKEILDTVNRMAEGAAVGCHFGMMYAFKQNSTLLNAWQSSHVSTFKLLDKLKTLSAGDPSQQVEIKKTGDSLKKIFSHLALQVISKKDKIQTDYKRIRSSGAGGFTQFRDFLKTSGGINLIQPAVEGLEAQERLMHRELIIGQNLARQRAKMIKNLELTLSAGFTLNIILSICLAGYMMRNLSMRLQHIMQNMDRLVKRERLEPALGGSDEIAFLDQTLFDTADRLVRLESFKRELIAVVSHELRTPLLSISSALESFEAGGLGELSPKATNRLLIAQEEASRLVRLINNLLDIEKMEAGKFILDETEFCVSELIEASAAAVAPLAEAKNVRLTPFIPSVIIKADRDRICQVLINLLSNAIKFSPSGASIGIEVCSSGQSNIEFRIIDKGKGIPEEMRTRIFERFIQVDKADAVERGGSGLGLAIAKAIIDQHNGSIGVRPTPGGGSTFWFTIPSEEPAIERTRSIQLAIESITISDVMPATDLQPIWTAQNFANNSKLA